MENRKTENTSPELADEELDRASGGGGNFFADPYEKKCSLCSGRLITDEEKRASVCRNCRNGGIVPGRP